jgi:hypothetical protein
MPLSIPEEISGHEGVMTILDMDEISRPSSSSTVMAVVSKSHICYTGRVTLFF